MTGMGGWLRTMAPLLRVVYAVLLGVLVVTAYLVGVVLLVMLVSSALWF